MRYKESFHIVEALPCPFCGGKILHEVKKLSDTTHRGKHHIYCPSCGALSGGGGDFNEALQKHNMRVIVY